MEGGTTILLNIFLQHTTLESSIQIEEKVQWLICNLENSKIGLFNIYASNSGHGRAF